MNFCLRLWRTLSRVALVMTSVLLGLVLLALGLTLGLTVWLWLRVRRMKGHPVPWTSERVYRGASASPVDVVDVEAVVRRGSPRSAKQFLIDPPT